MLRTALGASIARLLEDPGVVEVMPARSGAHLIIDILDDGGGLPDGFKMGKQKSLGLAIISTLIADLDGTVSIKNRKDAQGTVARIELDVPSVG